MITYVGFSFSSQILFVLLHLNFDVNDANYSGGFTITNHNYIIPAEWSLGGVIITSKQWKNNIDYSYTYNDPSVVHFFLTEDSDIRNSISVTSVNNIRKQFR